jgi:hypothetical protein
MAAKEAGKCRCGCGSVVRRGGQWMPGHDHRAVQSRIRTDFGNVSQFLDWYDGREGRNARKPAGASRTRHAAA